MIRYPVSETIKAPCARSLRPKEHPHDKTSVDDRGGATPVGSVCASRGVVSVTGDLFPACMACRWVADRSEKLGFTSDPDILGPDGPVSPLVGSRLPRDGGDVACRTDGVGSCRLLSWQLVKSSRTLAPPWGDDHAASGHLVVVFGIYLALAAAELSIGRLLKAFLSSISYHVLLCFELNIQHASSISFCLREADARPPRGHSVELLQRLRPSGGARRTNQAADEAIWCAEEREAI